MGVFLWAGYPCSGPFPVIVMEPFPVTPVHTARDQNPLLTTRNLSVANFFETKPFLQAVSEKITPSCVDRVLDGPASEDKGTYISYPKYSPANCCPLTRPRRWNFGF